MTSNNDKLQLNITEGTVEFTVKENKIDYSNDESVPLFQISPLGGSVFIVKDSDKKIKFFHVYLGKGRTDVEFDVSKLDKSKKHHFVFTWDVMDKELKLYIDGELKQTKKIKY